MEPVIQYFDKDNSRLANRIEMESETNRTNRTNRMKWKYQGNCLCKHSVNDFIWFIDWRRVALGSLWPIALTLLLLLFLIWLPNWFTRNPINKSSFCPLPDLNINSHSAGRDESAFPCLPSICDPNDFLFGNVGAFDAILHLVMVYFIFAFFFFFFFFPFFLLFRFECVCECVHISWVGPFRK